MGGKFSLLRHGKASMSAVRCTKSVGAGMRTVAVSLHLSEANYPMHLASFVQGRKGALPILTFRSIHDKTHNWLQIFILCFLCTVKTGCSWQLTVDSWQKSLLSSRTAATKRNMICKLVTRLSNTLPQAVQCSCVSLCPKKLIIVFKGEVFKGFLLHSFLIFLKFYNVSVNWSTVNSTRFQFTIVCALRCNFQRTNALTLSWIKKTKC